MEIENTKPYFQTNQEDSQMSDQELSSYLSEVTTQSVLSFSQQLLSTASEYLGVSRDSDLTQIARFLDLFDLPTKINGKWVPFCAAGLSYAATKAYCIMNKVPFTFTNAPSVFKSNLIKVKSNYFLPSASCGFIMEDAQKRGTWISKEDSKTKEILPGYLVLYNWKGGTWPDHIGIVESHATELHTIEFNTSGADNINGGYVSKRTRNYDCVLGYVKIV